MKIATKKNSRSERSFPDRCLPAIVAVGSSLATLPAGALELGELTVQSHLGQPLRASIAYALAPTERISGTCVSIRPGPSTSGLPGFGAARISIANSVILLTGETPVREPMVSAHIVINCPDSANLSREYMLFIDPVAYSDTPVYQKPVVTQQVTPRAEPVVVAPAAVERPVAAVRPVPVIRDLETSTRYQVQRGETLSEIAARIQNRPIGLWPAVEAIFEANPSAFIRNDPNKLKAGSWLSIPSFDGSAAVLADVKPTVADVAPVDAAVAVYEPSFAAEVTPTEEAQVAVEIQTDSGVADLRGAGVDGADVEGVDVGVVDANDASAIVLDDLANSDVTVGELEPDNIILDTELPGPTTSSNSPNVTTAVIATSPASESGEALPSWLAWLAGSVVAIAFGLMMFRRRFSGEVTATEAPLATGQPQRSFSDTQSTDTKNTEVPEVDYDISDDSPTEENLALDADLIMGTGLSDSANSDISDGFRFAESSELDVEVPSEPAPEVPNLPNENSILDSEVLPIAADDDNDMSVIIDATRIPDADIDVLEQDDDEELTATQALNLEIANAAAELTAKMEVKGLNNGDDETSALPLATVTELEVTAQMPARNDDVSSSDDNADSEAVTANTPADEDTVEMPVESGKSS